MSAAENYDVAHIAELAELAFWSVVGEKVPEATYGDLDPLVCYEFRQACEKVVEIWIDTNAPEEPAGAGIDGP